MRGALALVAALAGCGVAQPPPRAPTSDVLVDDGDKGPARPSTCPATAAYVASVRSRVVDGGAHGVAGAMVQLCITTDTQRMMCLAPGATDDNGDVTVTVPDAAGCVDHLGARVLLPGSHMPADNCDIALPLDDASVTIAEPFVLVDATPATALPDLGDANAMRTVEINDGLAVDVTPAAIAPDDYPRLAASVLASADAPRCVAAGAADVDVMIAFSPESDVVGAGFPFALENTEGLAAGAAVDLFVQGGLDCHLDDGTLVNKGEWRQFGTALVDADGSHIRGSLPCLGWLGLKLPR